MAKAPVGEIVELAVLAEQMGYERCWLFDEGVMTRDVFVTLAAIAERTSTIKIGPESPILTCDIPVRLQPLLHRLTS